LRNYITVNIIYFEPLTATHTQKKQQ